MGRPDQGKMTKTTQRHGQTKHLHRRLLAKGGGVLRRSGQALVEYVLITVFVIMAIIGIIALTGPAVGNIFSNAVINLLQQTWTPYPTLSVDQLGTYIAAVASYTPPPRTPNPNVFIPTNTPQDPDPLNPTNTPTATLTKTSSSTPTTTGIAPTQTPVDQQFLVNNAYNPGDLNQWHFDNVGVPSRARFAWQAQYYNGYQSFGGAPIKTEIIQEHLRYNFGTGAPSSGVPADNFSVLYTALDAETPNPMSPGVPFTAGEVWEVRVTGNEYFRVEIGGSPVVTNITAGSADGTITKMGYYVAPSTGIKQVLVYFSDQSGASEIDFVINRVTDYGTCKWSIASFPWQQMYYRSPSSAWADSQDGTARIEYPVNSSCVLRQRGWYDISSMDNPRLIFWNRWKLNTGDSLIVGVRDYNSTEPWLWKRVHTTIGTNFNWNRIVLDLEEFSGSYIEPTGGGALGQIGPETQTKDFSAGGAPRRVEIAFRVLSDNADTEDGWYLDDIGIFEYKPTEVTIVDGGGGSTPYEDLIDGGSVGRFVNECTWRTVNETGRTAWWSGSFDTNPSVLSPAPYGNYSAGSDCPLTIDRVFVIPTEAESIDLPLLEFESKVRLAGATDRVLVEYSEVTTTGSGDTTFTQGPWLPLPRQGDTTPYIYQGTNIVDWESIKVSLQADMSNTLLRGKKIMLRFRLLADTDSNVASGWWIDNVRVRLNSVTEDTMPFYEPFTDTIRWNLNGWARTTGADPFRSGPTALTDSPGAGSLYAINVDMTAYLIPAIRITGSTKPTVSFWARWQIPTANVKLDMSINDGATWTKISEILKPVDGSENRAWYRYEIDLVSKLAALGQTVDSAARVMFRFNIKGTGSGAPADGVYIDDFRVEDQSQPPLTITTDSATEFLDTMNSAASADNWYVGGLWAWANDQGKPDSAGVATGGWLDSPPGTPVTVYDRPERSAMELRRFVDTTAAQAPAIVFWTKYNLGTSHSIGVEVKPIGLDWVRLWSTSDAAVAISTNTGWHRVVVPINLSLAQQPFKVRIVLDAMDSLPPADGLNIDDFQILDRVNWTQFTTFAPGFDTMSDPSRWVLEGNWKVPATGTAGNTLWGYAEYTPSSLTPQSTTWTGTGYPVGGVTSSGWVGDYYHNNSATYWTAPSGRVVDWNALLATGANLPGRNEGGNLNFDFGSDSNKPVPSGVPAWDVGGLTNNEWYALRWRRRFSASAGAQTYLFRLEATGGAQVVVDGTVLTPNLALPKPYTSSSNTPEVAETARRVFYYSVPISGTVTVEVRFLHSTNALSGSAFIDFRIAQPERVARSSAWESPYTHLTRTSLILNGYLTIPAGQFGFVQYQERWSLADTDYVAAWYSLDLGGTWTKAASTEHGANGPDGTGLSTQDWVATTYQIPNLTGSPVRVILKWQLESLVNASVADGWLVDNVIFSTGTGGVNVPPTAVTMNLTTTANTATPYTIPTVTDANLPADYFNITSPANGSSTLRGVVSINDLPVGSSDQLRFTPLTDWTGTEQFNITVEDKGAATVSGFVSVTVDPKFYLGIDFGDSSGGSVGTIDGNAWIAQNGGTTVTTTGSSGALASVTPSSGSTAKDDMLRDYINGTDFRVDVTVPNGVYSYYVYTVSTEAAAQTYDLYTMAANTADYGQRILDEQNSGAQGNWQKHGPFTVKANQGRIRLRLVGGTGGVAGIEIYQGGAHAAFTSVDISPRASSGIAQPTNPGTTTIGGTITIVGSGNDVWNTDDGARYVYKAEAGDVEVRVLVDSVNLSPDSWAKAGLMLRSTQDADSPMVVVNITRDNGIYCHYRATVAAGAANCSGTMPILSGTAPRWLRIVKSGNTFTVGISSDGVTWTDRAVGTSINMGSNYLVGMFVTAHNNSQTATATFSNWSIIPR